MTFDPRYADDGRHSTIGCQEEVEVLESAFAPKEDAVIAQKLQVCSRLSEFGGVFGGSAEEPAIWNTGKSCYSLRAEGGRRNSSPMMMASAISRMGFRRWRLSRSIIR